MGRFSDGLHLKATDEHEFPFIDDTGVLWGSDMNDHMVGTADADSMRGWMGDDLIIGLNGDDRLHGCTGNDTLKGGYGDDLLVGCFGNDDLHGGGGNDVLFGDRYDPIDGSQFANSRFDGLSFLMQDTLAGGGGSDTFVLASGYLATIPPSAPLTDLTAANMLTDTRWDTITDLNLDQDKVALDFAVSTVAERQSSDASTLAEAVNSLFASGGTLENATGKAVLLDYGGDTWLVVAGQMADTSFGTDDVLAKVTDVTGTLGVDDFVLAQHESYVIGNENQFLTDWFFG